MDLNSLRPRAAQSPPALKKKGRSPRTVRQISPLTKTTILSGMASKSDSSESDEKRKPSSSTKSNSTRQACTTLGNSTAEYNKDPICLVEKVAVGDWDVSPEPKRYRTSIPKNALLTESTRGSTRQWGTQHQRKITTTWKCTWENEE